MDFDWIATQQEAETWIDANAHKIGMMNVCYRKVSPERGSDKLIAEGKTNVEFELVRPGTSSEMLVSLVEQDPETLDTPFGQVPSFDLLFTLKSSHKYVKFDEQRHSAFWKHALDWHIMRKLGAGIRDEYKEFLALREKETYYYQLPKLNMSKADFFDTDKTGVFQVFEHDDIHRAIALNDKPAYEYYLKDGSEVLTSKRKFFEVDEHIRMCGVAEEAMTLALERSIIAHPGVWTADYAFKFALAKVATTITGGYFREYTFNHLFDVVKLYRERCVGYEEKFRQAVKEHRVRYIKK